MLLKAKEFAAKKHSQQKYGEHPYTYHLSQVVMTLEKYVKDASDTLLASGWLHDVLEDTDATHYELGINFNEEVASIVHAVTDAPGKNRRERHLNTFPKIQKNNLALLVKLADRVANVNNCLETNNKGLFKMYKKEYKIFREALMNDFEPAQPFWAHLDNLLLDKV